MSDILSGVLKTAPGGAVKATRRSAKVQPGLVEGYLVTFGNPRDADLEREFFTRRTDLCLNWFTERPCLYHHGLDKTVGLKSIGVIKSAQIDDMGLWVQAQLNMVDEYAKAVYEMIQAKTFGWSSGSVEHLVKVAENGEIMQWPVIEGSITPTPAQPAKTQVFPVKSVSALATVIGQDWLRGLDAAITTATDRVAADSHREVKSFSSTAKETQMGTSFAARRMARAVLHSYGIKASEDDIAEVAADIEPIMQEEIEGDSIMQDDDPLMAFLSDDEAYMQDDDPLMAFLSDFEDEATMQEDDEIMSILADLENDATMEDDPLMAFLADHEEPDGDEAMMFDEPDGDEAMMFDEPIMARRSRGRRRKSAVRKSAVRKSADMRRLESRLARLEGRELAGERGVGRGIKSVGNRIQVTDAADVPGAYPHAFKTYLRNGLAWMTDNEKYMLRKGQEQWGRATGFSDSSGVKSLDAVKVFTSGLDSSVGFAVPPDWIAELNKNLSAYNTMAKECQTRTTSSDRLQQPYLLNTDARRTFAATAISYPGETPGTQAASEATQWALGLTDIPIHVHLVNYLASQSSLEDASFDLQAAINESFAEAIGVAYDTNIYSGDGNGKMLGIVTDPRVITSASSGVSSVGGYVAAGSTTKIPNGDVLKQMFMNLPAPYRARAKWYMNSDTLLQVAQLKDGNGQYLWDINNEAGLRGGIPETLMGRPIVVNEWAQGISSGNYPIIFADLTKGYLVAQRVEFSIRRFDEVYAFKDQVLFLGRARLGGQVDRPEAIKVLKMATS